MIDNQTESFDKHENIEQIFERFKSEINNHYSDREEQIANSQFETKRHLESVKKELLLFQGLSVGLTLLLCGSFFLNNQHSTESYKATAGQAFLEQQAKKGGQLSNMFNGAKHFNANIGSWDVSKVRKMDGMFKNASHFKQDLSHWCVPLIKTKPIDFDKGAGFENMPELQPKWGTCPK